MNININFSLCPVTNKNKCSARRSFGWCLCIVLYFVGCSSHICYAFYVVSFAVVFGCEKIVLCSKIAAFQLDDLKRTSLSRIPPEKILELCGFTVSVSSSHSPNVVAHYCVCCCCRCCYSCSDMYSTSLLCFFFASLVLVQRSPMIRCIPSEPKTTNWFSKQHNNIHRIK